MIYLIGYMGSGKTTIGKHLSKKLNMPFIDTDKLIESESKKSINCIFHEFGEDYFRELEYKLIRRNMKPHVIACGGGLPIYNNNIEYINKNGVSIYLKCSIDILFNRLNNNLERPILKNLTDFDLIQKISTQLLEREKLYNNAKFKVNVSNKDIESILREINSFISSI